MSETGHSQPPFSNGWNRKKKRYRDFSRDQDYYDSQSFNASNRDSFPTEDLDKSQNNLSQTTTKPPVILAKPGKSSASNASGMHIPVTEKTSSWQEVATSPTTAVAPKLSLTFSRSPHTSGSDKKFSKPNESKYRNVASPNLLKQSLSQVGAAISNPQSTGTPSKLKETMSSGKTVKMLDSSFHWIDEGIELLQDQNDFMVVGVIGMQSVGKSTILSIVSGNHFSDLQKSFLFKQQTQEVRERASHMTIGIDMAVTSERLILLDTQPILSSSFLEQSIPYDRKGSGDYIGSSTIEIQSLQIAAFLLTACHVIIVVQDWFTDSNIYRFLQTAEMLKPSTTPPSHDANSSSDNDQSDIQPVIVFVHNKIDSNMFNIRSIASMSEIMSNMVKFSSVHCRGYFSLIETNLYPGLSSICPVEKEVNSYLFPFIDDSENNDDKTDVNKITNDPADRMFLSLPTYVGRPSISLLETTFRKMILSMPRHQLTRHSLSEKNWFHYAARTWETIRKSQLVSEYNRLLSG